MNKHKIAILTDTGGDVPQNWVKQLPIYLLPLKINYADREYLDGVEISAREVYERLPREIPKTSLPSGQQILDLLDRIRADGYEKVYVVCLSSGLSGTFNIVKLICDGYDKLTTFVLDSRNISIGSGLLAIQAAQYAQDGMDWATLLERMPNRVFDSKVFFCVKTLEYLEKGGRIGHVTAFLGSAIKLKPVISCNNDGVYYTIAKALGRKAAIHKVMDLAARFAEGASSVEIALMHGDAQEEAAAMEAELKNRIKNGKISVRGQISPSLGVHTGPGLLGVGILRK